MCLQKAFGGVCGFASELCVSGVQVCLWGGWACYGGSCGGHMGVSVLRVWMGPLGGVLRV